MCSQERQEVERNACLFRRTCEGALLQRRRRALEDNATIGKVQRFKYGAGFSAKEVQLISKKLSWLAAEVRAGAVLRRWGRNCAEPHPHPQFLSSRISTVGENVTPKG